MMTENDAPTQSGRHFDQRASVANLSDINRSHSKLLCGFYKGYIGTGLHCVC